MKKTRILKAVVIAVLIHFCPSVDAQPKVIDHNSREYILRLTPSFGYITKDGSNRDPFLGRLGISKKLESFDYILLNMDVDAQVYHDLFATVSFIYSHEFYKEPVSGGIDIFGVPLGIKYILLKGRSQSRTTTGAIDDLRYWVGAFSGPYVMNESITVNIGGRNTHGSSTNTAMGVGAQTGFDYFLGHNIGFGVQAKFQYIFFDDNIMIISGGPSIIGRF